MIVQQNQTLADIAIMASGTIETLFSIAGANNKSITDTPVPGDDYLIPATVTADNNTLQYLVQNNIKMGTMAQTIPQGIGYWIIETDFTIN